jgi:16S rRNA (uracil1498-N3)-methyltransferase
MSRRFYIDAFLVKDQVVSILGPDHSDERKHMVKVMRKQVGEFVILTNGRNQEAEAEILTLDKSSASFRILQTRELEVAFPLTLIQGILKGPRMDWLVEKITELGVQKLQPILSTNVASADGIEDTQKRSGRWQRLSLAAVKQSGAALVLEIAQAKTLVDLQVSASDIALFCSFGPKAKPVGEVLEICKDRNKNNIFLAVGPEAGFTAEEESCLENKGFLPISLGSNTLRGETAALVACALARDWIDFYRRNDINI